MKKIDFSVEDILFSNGSYEVKIRDKKKFFWVFLRLDQEGKIIDSFCDCPKKKCSHLKEAYLAVTKEKKPLHVLFQNSFWYTLFSLIGEKYDFKNIFQGKKRLKTAELLIEVKTFSILKELLEEVKKEPKDNLLFFDLSEEEVKSLEEGSASKKIKYELSAFANLARYFFLLQYNGKLKKAELLLDREDLPIGIKLRFLNLTLALYLNVAIFSKIIEYLNNLPLDIEVFLTPLVSINYDAAKREFILREKEKKEGKIFDKWLYVPKEGFYLQKILDQNIIGEENIAKTLDVYARVLAGSMENTSVFLEEVSAQYFLFFDHNKSLHIKCYILDKDDFDKSTSSVFGNWVYIEGKGFFKIKDIEFSGKEIVFIKDDVSSFINLHRDFLGRFPGFKVHLGNLPSHIQYHMGKDGLQLEIKYEFEEGQVLDFDEWLYLENEGFFPKRKEDMLFFRGLIKEEEIENFVTIHKEELREVKGFFVKKKIVKNVSLQISLNEKEQIEVTPVIHLMEDYEKEQIKFFGDFIYVEGEGFCELSGNFKLPKEYRQKQIVTAVKEEVFLKYELKKLKPFISFLDKRLKRSENLELVLKKAFKVDDIYCFDFEYTSDLGSEKLFKIWQAVNRKKKFCFSNAGLLFLKHFHFSILKNFKRRHFSRQFLRLTFLEAIRFLAFVDIVYDCDDFSRKIIEELSSFTEGSVNIEGFNGQLRSYQEIGVRWLWFLYLHGLSGLLCDEMGLGKTQQAMALIAAIMNKQQGLKYLVVCPTSVMYHWQNLLSRFLPKAKVLFYHGILRSLDTDFDIILTSYGVLRLSLDKVINYNFELAIFDEMQIAKNFSSKINHILRQMKSKVKIGLTGTPVENRVREIKALFDVVLPNYFPMETQFKQNFIIPIEKEDDEEKKKILAKLVSPFVLRRKKKDVLEDLPEKMEEEIYCELSEEQHVLYKDEVLLYRNKISNIAAETPLEAKPVYFHIFSLITRLKRLCDHPRLILKDTIHHESGKWDLFIELLSEARESYQKVVVFSQYIEMLAIIEEYLTKENIGFASIKGSTRKREEEVKRFQHDPKCEVFVASLLAAGLGIDLSSASVVIHYDRWWNPAKEDQATDRVHRIGQTRGVQVFKLVVKDSVEEHILKIIEKKRGLVTDMLRESAQPLTKEEIWEIFQQINQDIN